MAGEFSNIEKALAGCFLTRRALVFRLSLGVVFIWFGILKFFPGLSPAETIAGETIHILFAGMVPVAAALKILAVWEVLLGIGFMAGRYIRLVTVFFLLHMAGAMSPLVILPAMTFSRVPWAPTLEGQYIIKNLVLIAAALYIWAESARAEHKRNTE